MQKALTLSLVALLACGRGSSTVKAPPGVGVGGPDAILIRIPRGGGTARAYRWGRDSVLWTSRDKVPALDYLLAFDDEQGSLAYVDKKNQPGRLDLRVGSATVAVPASLSSLASFDGWAIYGVTAKREVTRSTPSGAWTLPAKPVPRALLPQPDGSLILVNELGNRSVLRRLHPPESRITDTASVPSASLIVQTLLGDRLYLAGDSGLAGVRVQNLARTKTISLSAPVRDAAATPSGDRIFVALEGKKELVVIDRYEDKVTSHVALPSPATALRMDPDGRFLLARPAGEDSVMVISIGSGKFERVVNSVWRDDVPLVAPDGGLLLLEPRDAIIVDARTDKERMRFPGGAHDFWSLVRWNGFRPRAAGLDEPVSFADDTTEAQPRPLPDSLVRPRVADASTPASPPPTAAPAAPAAPTAVAAPAPWEGHAWTLSFAAMLDEGRAKTLAKSITVDGRPVRVVPTSRDGVPVYRVVFGPYTSKADAEAAGKRSGLSYWVYEGAP